MPLTATQITPLPVSSIGRVFMLAPPGAAPQISYTAQTETNWCWAACGEMLFSQPAHTARSQCNIASTRLGIMCCPSPGAPQGCDVGGWPHVEYPPLGLPTTIVRGAMSIASVQQELAAQKPVQVCYQWAGGNSTHVALIVDQHSNGEFEVYDPSTDYGQGSRSYNQILKAYGMGAWIMSFTF